MLATPMSGILLSDWSSSSSQMSPDPSSSPSSSSSPPYTPRRIRFAPLPDPRRPLLVANDHPDLSDDPKLPPLEDTSSLSSFCSSKRNSDSTDPGTATPASITNTTPSEHENSAPASPVSISAFLPLPIPPKLSSTSAWPKSRALSLFRPFKRSSGSSSSSSSLSLTPTPSIDPPTNSSSQRKGITTEEIFTLGTINLFRTSSRESNRENDQNPSTGWSLSRWSSTGGSSAPSSNSFGSPLARTQSAQSYKSHTPSFLSHSSTKSSSSKSKPPIRKGTRMLNGRVYGAPKRPPNVNPFANARDEEPEFVEWGYGGMGSVKGAKSAGVAGAGWERLHGSGSVMNGGNKIVGTGGDDEADDGSGMGWVKRRREARERKEREERESVEKTTEETAVNPVLDLGEGAALSTPTLSTITESATSTPTASTPDITSAHVPTPVSLAIHIIPLSPVSSMSQTGTSTPSREIASPFSTEEEHVFKTMTVPVKHHHNHHRSHSKANSKDATFLSPTASLRGDAGVDEKTYLDLKALTKKENADNTESSESESESEEGSDSEENGEREDEDDDDDDEEDEEEQEKKRKTALGAGVEKISWHKTEVEEREDI